MPQYRAETQLSNVSGTFITYALPGTSILNQPEDVENSGLPAFSVLNSNNFVIIQDSEPVNTAQIVNTIQRAQPTNEPVSETESMSSVSDIVDGTEEKKQKGPKTRRRGKYVA